MTATFRRAHMWVKDGENTYGHNGRKSRSKDKPLARRVLRREHHDVTREAVRSYYVDGADDLYDHLYGDDYMEGYFDNTFIEPEWDEYEWYIEEEEYDYGYDLYGYSYDPYDEYYPLYAPRPAYDPMQDYSVRREDIGRSLSEILAELLSKNT